MDHNPYTPPQATTETPEKLDPTERPPRPISVWLFIVLLLVFVLIFVRNIVQFAGVVSERWNEIDSFGLLIITFVWRLSITALFLATAYCAYRGRQWTRWVGMALLILFAAYSIFRTDETLYASDAERAGAQVARILMPVLLGWWAYALAFSSKAKRYFSRSPPVAE